MKQDSLKQAAIKNIQAAAKWFVEGSDNQEHGDIVFQVLYFATHCAFGIDENSLQDIRNIDKDWLGEQVENAVAVLGF